MQEVISAGAILRDRFEVRQHLGYGGYGSVYKAIDLELGREVAIKFLKVLDKQVDLRRFRREAKYMSLLSGHPNIAKVYAIDLLDDDKPYIVMEFLEGRSLNAALRSSDFGLPYEQAKKILDELCSALSYAHKQGIVHRDVSPRNVFLVGSRETPTAKLIDFGLASLMEKSQRQTQTITRTGSLVGNFPYMSPESCKGLRADHLSDIYSLGCTLYEMLTGKPPFCDLDLIAILHRHVSEYPAEPVFHWDNKQKELLFRNITLKCLQKDKKKRFQSVEEIVQALESESFEALGLEPWSSLSKCRSGSRRDHKSWYLAGMFSLAVVIVAMVVGVSFKTATNEQSLLSEFEEKGETADLNKQVQNLLGARDDFSQAGYVRRSHKAFQLCRSTEDLGAIPVQTRLEACNAYAESLTMFGLPRMSLRAYHQAAKWWSVPSDPEKIRQVRSVSHTLKIYSFASLGNKDAVARELRKLKNLSKVDIETVQALYTIVFFTHSGLMKEPDSLLPQLIELCSKKPDQLLELAKGLITFGKYSAAETCLQAFKRVSVGVPSHLGTTADDKYNEKLQILKFRLAIYEDEFPRLKQLKAQLKGDFERENYHPSYSDLDYFASEDLAIAFSLPANDNSKTSVSVQELKRLLKQGRGWREINSYVKRLLAQERDPDEISRLECLIAEIAGGLDASHSPAQAFLRSSSSTPRELRLRSMYNYASFLMVRGYYSKARELFNEFEQDIKKHGYPDHEDYGLKIDENVLAEARSLVLKSFIDAGGLEIAQKMMLSYLESGIKRNLATQMLRVDLIFNEGGNSNKIIEMLPDPEAAIDAARFLLRHGKGDLCRQCLSKGKDLLARTGNSDELAAALLISSFESLSYLEESNYDKARIIMNEELSRLREAKPGNFGLKRGRESASEVVGIFLLSLQLNGMEDSIEAAKSRLDKLFAL